MDASDIDDLINNYSDFEKTIDERIQACKKIKDNPDSANTALLIQLIESQKKAVGQSEKILFLSRIMGVLACGAFIIALGTLSVVYFAIGPEKTFLGSVIIVAAGIVAMGILLIILPRTERKTAKRK